MSALPSSAVSIGNGEITIAADLLAPKLGLSVEALNSEMRRGYVYNVTEQGIDDDAGRTRFTFGYRTRSWTVVVEPDRTLVETPSPANKASPAKKDRVSLLELVRKAS